MDARVRRVRNPAIAFTEQDTFPMSKFLALVAAGALSLAATAARADVIPYPNAGVENPVLYTFTATTTGNLSAYFYLASDQDRPAFEETLGLWVNGVDTGISGLNNQSAVSGDRLDFGSVTAGDVLTFVLNVLSTGDTFYSDKSLNGDSANHVYSTSFSGDPGQPLLPAGTYIAFEDLDRSQSDFNYADIQFILSNTSITAAVPEPSTWAMLILGFASVGLVAYRRRRPAWG